MNAREHKRRRLVAFIILRAPASLSDEQVTDRLGYTLGPNHPVHWPAKTRTPSELAEADGVRNGQRSDVRDLTP